MIGVLQNTDKLCNTYLPLNFTWFWL